MPQRPPTSPARLPVALNPPWGSPSKVSSAAEETARKLDMGPLQERKREEEEEPEAEQNQTQTRLGPGPAGTPRREQKRSGQGPESACPGASAGVFRPYISPVSPPGTGGAGRIQAACGLEHGNSQMISGYCSPAGCSTGFSSLRVSGGLPRGRKGQTDPHSPFSLWPGVSCA